MVSIYFDGVKVAKGTGYKYSKKRNNDKTDTFDGPDYTYDENEEISVSIDRIDTYNSQYETILANAIANNPDGIPITVVDGNVTDQFTGCMIDSTEVSRDPKKKRNYSLSFTAKTVTTVRK